MARRRIEFFLNLYSARGQLIYVERRLQKDDILQKLYQKTTDTNVKARYVWKIVQNQTE